MTAFARSIFGLLLLFAFVQFSEAKSIAATTLFDKASATQTSVGTDSEEKAAVAETARLVAEIVNASFPELKNASIEIKTFHSRADFFRSRFSVSRFLTFRKLHYLIFVNPQVFEKNAAPEAVRAIIAHELAHVAYYRRHNRFELLGLIALSSKSFTARFERAADLQAIKRGYGAGLKIYREWLYRNIPAEKIHAKRRDYFSPEEIDLLTVAIREKPALLNFWLKNVPRNLTEIKSDIAEK